MKKLVVVFLTLSMLVFGLSAFGADKMVIKSSDVHGDGYPTVEAIKYMGELLDKWTNGRLTIDRRIVQGTTSMVTGLVELSQGRGGINTAYIERLNATFRQRLAWLTRRTRHLAQQSETLMAGMFIVGCFYNFCDYHHSLRVGLWINNWRRHWVQMTPAMAAQLTDHQWSTVELFWFKIPPPAWTPPKRRGRPSKQMLELIETWAL